jgi:hypothetical protein
MMGCSVEGCEGTHKAHGWCSKHYQRWKHHGDPMTLHGTEPGAPLRFIEEVALACDKDECLVWPYARNPAGYGKISIDGKLEHVNRVVCERVHGPAPSPAHEAAHACGKGHTGCISPNHLLWKTPSENQADRLSHGTDNRGEKHPMAKLTGDEVREIVSSKGKVTQQALADRFGVDRSHIGLIQRGGSWRFMELRTGASEQKRSAA